jgi:hypothetical protein
MTPPTSPESLAGLRRLREEARARGDEAFSVLLSGLELYLSLGREFELLESMRAFAEEIKGAVENTPTAAELERLYKWNPRAGGGE